MFQTHQTTFVCLNINIAAQFKKFDICYNLILKGLLGVQPAAERDLCSNQAVVKEVAVVLLMREGGHHLKKCLNTGYQLQTMKLTGQPS